MRKLKLRVWVTYLNLHSHLGAEMDREAWCSIPHSQQMKTLGWLIGSTFSCFIRRKNLLHISTKIICYILATAEIGKSGLEIRRFSTKFWKMGQFLFCFVLFYVFLSCFERWHCSCFVFNILFIWLYQALVVARETFINSCGMWTLSGSM